MLELHHGGGPRQPHPGTRCHRCGCSLPGLTGFTVDRCEGTDGATMTLLPLRQRGHSNDSARSYNLQARKSLAAPILASPAPSVQHVRAAINRSLS